MNRFYNLTRIFSLSSLVLILLCYLFKNGVYPKINATLWILTITSLTMFVFYFLNEIIYYIKKKYNISHTKTIEVTKQIKKVKKKKPSYKKIKVDVEQYSTIPSIFLIVTSFIFMILTYSSDKQSESMVLFYFLNIPIFIVSILTLLITLSSNLQLKWLKTIYVVVFISLAFLCLICIATYQI